MLTDWLVKRLSFVFDYMGRDGMQHFICTSVASSLLSSFLPWWLSATLVLAVSFGREAMQARSLKVDVHDMICNVAGIAIAIVPQLNT